VRIYDEATVLAGLNDYQSSVERGNRFFNVDLNDGDSAWNPEGEPFDGPGSVTYVTYGRGGGTYARLSRPDDI
jgi:hypothetical protein